MGSSPPTKSAPAVAGGALEEGRRRIVAALKTAPLDAVAQLVTGDIAKLLGASTVRLYFHDVFADELYARWVEGSRTRELRVAPDPSSPVGYAAMTRSKSFAWKQQAAGDKRYVVAVPLVGGGDLLGVLELTHGTPNATPSEDAVKVFNDLAGHMIKRLQTVLKVTVRATPYDHLLNTGAVTPDEVRTAREKAQASGRSVESLLLKDCGVDKAALGRSLSEHFGCPFVADPATLQVSAELVSRFSPAFLKTHAVLPFARKGDAVHALVVNPRNLTLLDDVSRQAGVEKVTASVALREDILAALSKFAVHSTPTPPAGHAAAAAPARAEWDAAPTEDTSFSLEEKDGAVEVDSATIRLINETIQAAIDQGASDIHMEPTTTGGMVFRFRVDGVLNDYKVVAQACAKPAVSRVKIMAKLDIAEHRLPQDGKIRLKDRDGGKVDLRVAIVPTSGGFEDVVIRLLPDTQALPIAKLGMEPENFERFKRVIEQPHGIILCVGPTGSGKTTTLHAALGHVKGPGVKIWTAEDPVEITQDGIRQVQMHAKIGLTFAHALRAFLRCDPDVIMIGEIRDKETAGAAIEASLTGHLVLSTLHTNSASETVTRLLEMGLDPFTFGDSLLAVLAQRLVRRVCESCRETSAATQEEWTELRRQFGDDARFDALRIDRRKAVVGRAKGCDKCFHTGYRGRMGIHELLAVTPEIRRLIQQRAESEKIRRAAFASGMTLLKQDGVRKILQGLTDLKEVASTCIEENL